MQLHCKSSYARLLRATPRHEACEVGAWEPGQMQPSQTGPPDFLDFGLLNFIFGCPYVVMASVGHHCPPACPYTPLYPSSWRAKTFCNKRGK